MNELPLVILWDTGADAIWNRLPPFVKRTCPAVPVSPDERFAAAAVEAIRAGLSETAPRVVILSLQPPRDSGAILRGLLDQAFAHPILGRRDVTVSLTFLSNGSDIQCPAAPWSVFAFRTMWRGRPRDLWTSMGPFAWFAAALICTAPSRVRDVPNMPSFTCAVERPGLYAVGVESYELPDPAKRASEALDAAIAAHYAPAFSPLARRALEAKRVTVNWSLFYSGFGREEGLLLAVLTDLAARSESFEQLTAAIRSVEARCEEPASERLRDVRLGIAGLDLATPSADAGIHLAELVDAMVIEFPLLPIRLLHKRIRPASAGARFDHAYNQALERIVLEARAQAVRSFEESVGDLTYSGPLDPRSHRAARAALNVAAVPVSHHFHWPAGYNSDPRTELWGIPGHALLCCIARIEGKEQ